MGSERCKGIGVKLVKTATAFTAKLCIDIPDWLLMEVLIRLPVKQVFRLKLVCKQWHSVISDHSFIRMYVSMSPQFQTWTYISPVVPGYSDYFKRVLLEDVYSQDLKSPSMYVLPCPFSGQPDWNLYKIVGVSNGLVLYGPPDHRENLLNYYICNPITRQWISLPPHACHFFNFRRGFVTNVENGILTSYRVVVVEVLPFTCKAIRFEVFVSEIGEWKNYTISLGRAINICMTMPTAHNGILHWVTHGHGLIAYDPYDKPDCLRFIELPSDLRSSNDELEKVACGVCDVYQGHLRFFELSKASSSIPPHAFCSFCVWTLNDYSTEDWCVQYRINDADILYDAFVSSMPLYLIPISFHPFDSEIFYLASVGQILVSFNIKTQKLEAHRDPTNVLLRNGWYSAIPFVIPRWPTYITPLSFGVSKD